MILLVTHPEFHCLLHEILLGWMKRRNTTPRRRRFTCFADICIDFVHGWVGVNGSGSVSVDELDHVSGRWVGMFDVI